MLQISNLSFVYPFSKHTIKLSGQIVINNADKILIQGNSGCGKSTILLALCGIIPELIHGSYTGSILFKNQSIADICKLYPGKIGYLGQNQDHQIIGDYVINELAFGLENQGLTPDIILDKINYFAKRFEILHLLHNKISQLSGGEKQKVNLLAILLMDPDIIILDEPTAFLDPQSAYSLMDIVKIVCVNKIVVIVEHNIHYLKGLINRVIHVDTDGSFYESSITTINFNKNFPQMPCCKYQITNINQPLLKIANLSYKYQSIPLLEKINLQLNHGEVVGILGRNGSGKSTLLKLIAGVIKTKNSIFFENQDIREFKLKNYFKNIAIVFQNPENHFLYSTVNEELDNDHTLIAKFGLNGASNPFTLSEGQKRRLSLAISFKQEVKLFLLDEPTFGQDDNNKIMLANLISELVINFKKSFIIVSHDIKFITALTNKIYSLSNHQLSLWSDHSFGIANNA